MSFRDKLKSLVEEYGPIAIVTYFSLFGLVLCGTFLAMRLGFSSTSVAGSAGTFGAAYLFTKLTQPLRIGATFILTPLIARVWRRLRRTQPPPV